MLNVFISHNYKDKPMARKIAKELNRYGIKAWIDESEIKLGDSLIEKIRDGLDHMDFLVALISDNSIHSEWVKKELDIAMNSEIEGKRVVTIPILVGKCELPGFLKGKLYADMSTTRKYNENISTLIKRFDINEIADDENEFTEFKLNAVQVIEKIENAQNENEIVELLESFSYSEGNLFHRDTFIQAVNKLLEDKGTSLDVLASLLDACRYCPDGVLSKLSLTQLLDRPEEQILQGTMNVLQKKSLKIQQKKILKLLRECSSVGLERIIWDYFLTAELNYDIARDLLEFILENLKTHYSDKMMMCMCKLFNAINEDAILEEWYALWSRGSEEEQKKLANWLCRYGFESGEFFIMSPRMRDNIQEALLHSLGEKDTENAEIMIALLVGDSNLVEDRKELWDMLMSLDEYSVLLTLEKLRDDYNIAYVFNSVQDIEALKGFVTSKNRNIKKAALNIIAEINLKESLEIIKSEPEFDLQSYNAGSLLYTILKESNVEEYRDLFEKVKEKVENSYYIQADKNLIFYGDYLLGNVNLDDMIAGIQIEKENRGRQYDRRRKGKLLAEKLEGLVDKGNEAQAKRLRQLIESAKSIRHTY